MLLWEYSSACGIPQFHNLFLPTGGQKATLVLKWFLCKFSVVFAGVGESRQKWGDVANMATMWCLCAIAQRNAFAIA